MGLSEEKKSKLFVRTQTDIKMKNPEDETFSDDLKDAWKSLAVSDRRDLLSRQSEDGINLVGLTSKQGNLKMFTFFVDELGADINAPCTTCGCTPLIVAAANASPDVARYLVVNGADMTPYNEDGDDALLAALRNKNVEIARMLIEKGASPKTVNQNDNTTCLMLSHFNNELMTFMVEDGVDVNGRDIKGQTILHQAVKRRANNECKMLMKLGASPDVMDEDGLTPYDIAERSGNKELKEILSGDTGEETRYGLFEDVVVKKKKKPVMLNLFDEDDSDEEATPDDEDEGPEGAEGKEGEQKDGEKKKKKKKKKADDGSKDPDSKDKDSKAECAKDSKGQCNKDQESKGSKDQCANPKGSKDKCAKDSKAQCNKDGESKSSTGQTCPKDSKGQCNKDQEMSVQGSKCLNVPTSPSKDKKDKK